ncbi:hypothetical protein QL996_13400 [Planococcus sp. APC 4015]|nr:hypothetical protein [Planococcus sp. APC 4015]
MTERKTTPRQWTIITIVLLVVAATAAVLLLTGDTDEMFAEPSGRYPFLTRGVVLVLAIVVPIGVLVGIAISAAIKRGR